MLKRTFLIQHLRTPTKLVNPFNFGTGGLKNGGLNEEALALITKCFDFKYMGAAEFEWGAVPQALSEIYEYCKADKGIIGEVLVNSEGKMKPVYFLCSVAQKEYVAGVIKVQAANQTKRQKVADELNVKYQRMIFYPNLKEHAYLDMALQKDKDKTFMRDIGGWLELDNGFFFFTDATMFSNVVKLFNVKAEGGI